MKSVFLVQHSYELDSCDETKFIGVYKTNEEAKAAIKRLQKHPDFVKDQKISIFQNMNWEKTTGQKDL